MLRTKKLLLISYLVCNLLCDDGDGKKAGSVLSIPVEMLQSRQFGINSQVKPRL